MSTNIRKTKIHEDSQIQQIFWRRVNETEIRHLLYRIIGGSLIMPEQTMSKNFRRILCKMCSGEERVAIVSSIGRGSYYISIYVALSPIYCWRKKRQFFTKFLEYKLLYFLKPKFLNQISRTKIIE